MYKELIKDIESGSKCAITKKQIIKYYIYNVSSTITDLSKSLDLSIPTITKFINEMSEEGYIHKYGKLETNGGRHPTLYGLNPQSGYFIGVDFKKDEICIGTINFNGDLIDIKNDIPYKIENTQEALNRLCHIIKKYIALLTIDKEKIISICVNISGRVNPDSGYSYSIFNFSEQPLTEYMTEQIGIKVYIDNDSRAMTYGEYIKGCINGEKNVLFFNISWGLGLGIIIDGKLYKGKSGFSGEFGHINAFDNEILCHCGKKGCLETEVSGHAFLRILIERIKNGENSICAKKLKQGNENLTLEDVIQAVLKEDLLCIEILEEIGQKLGKQIASLINLFNPELVVIGGSLSQTEDYILQPIKTAVKKYSLNLVNKDTIIKTSKLKDNAGVIGACMIARSKMYEN